MDRFSTSLLGEAKTILLATDGSHYSDGAVQEAIFFGQACRARLIVLHVVPVQAESITAANFAVRKGREQLMPHLDQIRAMARDSGVELEEVVVGSSRPEQTIVEQARLREADVIFMGRHGRAGRLSLLVGQMTNRVLAQGFPRVLVAPKEFIITGSQVLVAVNDSPNSRQAVREALSLGTSCATLQRITMLAVARREGDRSGAEQILKEIYTQSSQMELPVTCDFLVEVGDPAERIITMAEERQVDMILIGNRGKGVVPRILKAHVTDNVIGRAHCAVLVVQV